MEIRDKIQCKQFRSKSLKVPVTFYILLNYVMFILSESGDYLMITVKVGVTFAFVQYE